MTRRCGRGPCFPAERRITGREVGVGPGVRWIRPLNLANPRHRRHQSDRQQEGGDIRGLIFDKDGTLYDFNGTWGAWSAGLIDDLAQGDAERRTTLAEVLGYDLAREAFLPGSIVIAHTSREVADVVLPYVPPQPVDDLVTKLNALAASVTQVAVTDLRALLSDIRARGVRTAVVTNDGEAPARAHLGRSGIETLFDFVAGYDSGYGSKPAPGPLLAAARAMELPPGDCAMIGDSTHDLIAGRAAGMTTVGVLTGPATEADLRPHADVVLPSIAALPEWLDATGSVA